MKRSTNKTITMWKIIKGITTDRKTIKDNITLRLENKNIMCPKLVANTFNKYFASVGSCQSSETSDDDQSSYRVLTPSINSLFLQPVTEQEISDIIRKLPNKHSFGVDDIPTSLVKICVNELTGILTYLINQSFNENTFPDRLKIAKIKPVLKKGGKSHDPSQYRPISILPSFSKVFEKAMTNRVYRFLEKYGIFDGNQFGFRKKRSTTLALYKCIQ